jgi:hypothetical protein
MPIRQFVSGVALFFAPTSLFAQPDPASRLPPPASRPIQDNSFLLEEAYNQEPAIVQHINSVLFDRSISSWVYSLTDEWPLKGQRHQISATIPVASSTSGSAAALGDVALNYRLQLIGSGESRWAVTPRLTIQFPTAAPALGGGTFALQGALASSYIATPKLALHTNGGITLKPNVETGTGSSGHLLDLIAGQSAIWLVHPRVNLMLESVLTSVENFTGSGTNRVRSTGITLSPGLRWSYDFESGLQIVPGIAFPFGFRANSAQRGLLLYLSFEHLMPGLPRKS